MSYAARVTIVIFSSIELQHRLETHRESCSMWPCYIITNSKIITNISYVSQFVVKSPCGDKEAYSNKLFSKYLLGDMRYFVGYQLMQRYIKTPWILLVDDDARVFPQSSGFINSMNPKNMTFLGDFGNQGQSRFACGGGGFLFSTSAFMSIDFNACIISRECKTGTTWMVDHLLERCLQNYTDIKLENTYNCGTCSNKWSKNYTMHKLHSNKCKFMHNQRSHMPKIYKNVVYKHLPLVVHRWSNFFE